MKKQSEHSTEKIIIKVDEDLEDLIPGFLERRQQDLITLREALKQKDFAQIRELAHTLKGVGGGYGFDAISSISEQLQQAAEQQSESEIEQKLIELTDYLRRIEVVFV